MATVRLNREAAAALVKEARRDFENGAHELYNSSDVSQEAVIAACVEVIGVLTDTVESRWPQETDHGFTFDRWSVDFELSPAVMAWIRKTREEQVGFIDDLDGGVCGAEPGYIAEQVYLLHVLDGILGQPEKVAA